MAFANVLAKLPPKFLNKVIEVDTFLKSLRPLKFRRTVEKDNKKITYISSDYGISYAITISGTEVSHHFGWYYLRNKEEKIWFRKTDYFVETLTEIAQTNPSSAERIFNSINKCSSCKGNPCSAISYLYSGQRQLACYGRIILPISHEGFDDALLFFKNLNNLVEHKL